MSEFDFSLVEKAGLTQSEFANLIEANRVTVNNWIRGRTSPHPMWHPQCRQKLTLLKAAIKLKKLPGNLPEPSRMVVDQRAEMIRDTLAEVEERLRKAKRRR